MRRRHLAEASAAVLLVGLAAPGKAAELDGELLARVDALVAHLTQERAARAAMTLEQRRELYQQRHRDGMAGVISTRKTMAAAIAHIPARTPEGTRAKARAMVWDHGGDDAAQVGVALGTGLLDSLLADLTGAACVLRPFPPAQREPWSAPDPDAAFLAHLDAYDALQADADTILARCGAADPTTQDAARLSAIYAAQWPEAEGMVATGCTTWNGRRRLAATLGRQGVRPDVGPEWGDNPKHNAESRMQALLLRSAFAAAGGVE